MSRPQATSPTVTKNDSPGGMHGTFKTHPAYGMLSFSRISGDPGHLFGSDIKHHMGFFELTLMVGEEHRTLSNHYYHGRRQLVQVAMSAAQFVELISTPNRGSGVPVTIRHLPNEEMPYIDDEDTTHEQMKADLTEDVAEVTAKVTELRKTLEATLAKSGLSKVKQAELVAILSKVESTITSSMPFVLDQYHEAIDAQKARAAVEIDSIMQSAATRIGFESLRHLAEATKAEEAKRLTP